MEPQHRTTTLTGRGATPSSTYVFLQVFCFFPFAFMTLSMLFIASFSFRVAEGTVSVRYSGGHPTGGPTGMGRHSVVNDTSLHVAFSGHEQIAMEATMTSTSSFSPFGYGNGNASSASSSASLSSSSSEANNNDNDNDNDNERLGHWHLPPNPYPNNNLYTFVDEMARFGPSLSGKGVDGELVIADPPHACGAIKPAPPRYNWIDVDTTGKKRKKVHVNQIAMIQRGPYDPTTNTHDVTCTFIQKVRNAQAAGFDAVIVYDDNYGELVVMGREDDGDDITIPSVFISKDDGDMVLDLLQEGYELSATLSDASLDEQLWGNMLAAMFLAGLCLSIIFASIVVLKRRQNMNQLYIRLALDALQEQHEQQQANTSTPRTIRTEELANLKTRKYDSSASQDPSFCSKVGAAGGTWETCTICLEDYEDGDIVRELPCGHIFHKECVDLWLTTKSVACPVCKAHAACLPINTEDTPLLSSTIDIHSSESSSSDDNSLDDDATRTSNLINLTGGQRMW